MVEPQAASTGLGDVWLSSGVTAQVDGYQKVVKEYNAAIQETTEQDTS
jgi:hypothetical protein